MPQQPDDRKRLVVPRWRPFHISARLGLLDAGTGSPHPPEPQLGELEMLRADWERHGTPGHAADLVDAALIVGRPEIATDAAAFLVEANRNPISRAIAHAVLEPAQPNEAEPQQLSSADRYLRIAAAKLALRRYPRDPIRMVDAAREYSILGQNDQAKAMLRRALILAPNNRFVVRAASRFFLHARDPDQAHRIIIRTAQLRDDPWLLAAEIVSAEAGDRISRWVRFGQRMVEGSSFDPRQTSELASAIGTLELEHGNRKGVRRMFDRALLDPTENTVAQAGWVSRHMPSFVSPQMADNVPRAYEAAAWNALLAADYYEAMRQAWKWYRDEPFATRPALFGSWVSVAIGNFGEAIRFMQAIEPANSDDPRVLAQLVFCFASLNQIDEAEAKLGLMPAAVERHASGADRANFSVMMAADRGLIAFRRGFLADGHNHYEQAMHIAKENGLHESAATAMLFYAREVARAEPELGRHALESARSVLVAFPESIRHVYEQIIIRAEQGLQ